MIGRMVIKNHDFILFFLFQKTVDGQFFHFNHFVDI